MKKFFGYKTETKTCYRFESGERPDLETLYLKKTTVDKLGIDPHAGLEIDLPEKK